MKVLNISGSPHVHSGTSIKRIMWDVNIALMPLLLVSILFFGIDALKLSVVSVVACVAFQYLIERFVMKRETEVMDGSAVITGLLLAFNVPSSLPIWILLVGDLVAIGVAKMSFGGLGRNLFNPALVGRVFLLVSWPVQMTTWPCPNNIIGTSSSAADALTGPTPLGILQGAMAKAEETGVDISTLIADMPSYMNMFVGQIGGSLGEISIVAILLGGIYMLVRKVISWHIPVSFIGTVFIFAAIMHMVDPALYVAPEYHILVGGLMLGAVFMATDMVTTPMSNNGKLIFGFGCGVLTMVIRLWSAYPEGVSFAILIMNALVPLINKGFKPVRFSK